MDRGSTSNHESSFHEERAARAHARLMRDHNTNTVWSMGSSVWSTTTNLPQSQQLEHTTSRVWPSGAAPFSLNQDTISLSESLRSPGQFGTAADWEGVWPQRYDGGDAPSNIERGRPTIEFPSMLPPMTLPGVASSPNLAHAPTQRPVRATMPPMRTRGPPISLLDPQIMRGEEGGMRIGGQQADSSFDALHLLSNSLPSYIIERWAREQNEAPARRARPHFVPMRRNSSSASSIDAEAGSTCGSIDGHKYPDCSYCRSVSRNPTGHNKHNCPILAHLPPCKICGANGKHNHTESHCPFTPKTDLQFIPKTFRPRTNTI